MPNCKGSLKDRIRVVEGVRSREKTFCYLCKRLTKHIREYQIPLWGKEKCLEACTVVFICDSCVKGLSQLMEKV